VIDGHPVPTNAAALARRVAAHSVMVVVMHAAGPPAVAGDDDAIVVTALDAAVQLPRRFDAAWVSACVTAAPPEALRAGLHQAVQHLGPGGWLGVASADATCRSLCDEFDIALHQPLSTNSTLVFRRPARTTVHDLLFEARSTISRIDVHELDRSLRSPEPPLVIDTRTHVDRTRTGVIEGSVHIPRTVLEWHLDPTNGYRHPMVTSFEQPIVVVCNGGYSSSLAAANLRRLGFTNVADLVGGVHAWCAAGLPTVVADHSHVDL
jgi:rhodanese-related sulfurtransferase